MRFDVPVIGVKTIEVMQAAGATCLALDAGRCLLLDGEKIVDAANAAGDCDCREEGDRCHEMRKRQKVTIRSRPHCRPAAPCLRWQRVARACAARTAGRCRCRHCGCPACADVHSIWELVLHIAVWDGAGFRRLGGKKCQLNGDGKFSAGAEGRREAAWRKAVAEAKRTHDSLVKTVAALAGFAAARPRSRESGTTSITCCTESRSMSCIMRGRLRF